MQTSKMYQLLFIEFLSFILVARCQPIHEYMTPEEVKNVFHTSHKNIPPYEIVPVQHKPHSDDRSYTQQMQLKAFNQELSLYLEPTEGYLVGLNTPVWTVRSEPLAPEGLQYELVENAMASLATTYHDVSTMSAISAERTANNRLIFDGTIGSDLVIRSLPDRVVNEVLYGENGLYEPHFATNNTNDENLIYTYHHVVYKKPALKGKLRHNDGVYSEINQNEAHDNDHSRSKRSVPEFIYPQILIVVDYNEYALIGKDIEQAKRYIVSFFNGVDLRYRTISNPKIRFNIAGIIIALDDGALPYVDKNRLDYVSVEADRALRNMSMYFYRETRFPWEMYDMAIAITPLDLCNMDEYNFCDPMTLGYAFVAGACNRNDTKKISEAVGIVEDNGGFSGIIPVAHEIGHLIGAHHDGHSKTAYSCSPYEGYIMTSDLQLSENGFQWSNCTLNSFYKFFNEERSKCLQNPPPSSPKVARILPGKLLSLDLQCQKAFGTNACREDASVCTALDCVSPGLLNACTAAAAAAEGSPCGKGMLCINGKCILEGLESFYEGTKSSQTMNFKPLPTTNEIRIDPSPVLTRMIYRNE